MNCKRQDNYYVKKSSRRSRKKIRLFLHRLHIIGFFTSIEEQNLHPVSSLVGEEKQMAALRVLLELPCHQSI